MTLDDFSRLHRQRIDDCLSAQLESLPPMAPRLRDAMRYGLLLGGKRVRPFLVYAVGEMLGVKRELLDGPAAAVECIHAYSLLHDDLPAMDDDDLRRGQPTVHKAFDEGTAILAGDALQTLAFSILADHPMPDSLLGNRVRMLSRLARASGYLGMCGGQALDLQAEGRQITLAELEQVHRHKTGALIECAVALGALCKADVDETTLSALTKLLPPPSVSPSRCRMTSSTSRVTPPPSASDRVPIWRWKRVPIRRCWGSTMPVSWLANCMVKP